MKRILFTLLATLSGLVLLFSYRTSLEAVTPTDASAVTGATGTSATGTGSSGTGSSGTGSSDTGATSSTSTNSGATSGTATSTGTGLADGTFTGVSSQTRYGPVQVQITVSGGTISDVQAIDYPDSNGRDRQINGSAIPRLVSETLQSQSSQIQMVSGATYTSEGYMSSLQSAIDQARS